MPGFDGQGPRGRGPARGLGPCGIGFRRGSGRGFGMGFRYAEPVELSKTDQKKILEEHLKVLEEEKQEIEKRIKELK